MKKPFSITIDEELYEKLKEMAEEQGRTISNMIEFLVRKAVDQK